MARAITTPFGTGQSAGNARPTEERHRRAGIARRFPVFASLALVCVGGLALAGGGDPQELLQRAATNPTTAPSTQPTTQPTSPRVPDLQTLLSKPQSPMTAVQQRYEADR